MRRSSRNPWFALAVLGGLGYPLLVYFGLQRLPPGAIVFVGLALIGLRLLATWRSERHVAGAGMLALTLAATGLAALLFLAPRMAALAYPIAISLATAAIFGLSLLRPPSVVERIVRIREPDLPPEGVAYARKVTMVWTVFLMANAAVSAASAVWGSLEAWTLWNGLISYLLMGALFLGEIGVRQVVRRPAALP
ncbi:MAG TPA: hypothetical protein VGV37_16380 [Aliidongia sp.]|uniref:COG4648 family protein n=1 Tax=Aliidongia sp. TaxID=1914230 RepID=UPI002DDD1305|nr:hypothetical protein [Aliidongia sp.]HEV2676102.1 hypothetical protein [Aliidongia sp.]